MARAFQWFSALMCVLALWAASLQLNDPDPERWFAMYAACALVAVTEVLDRALPWLAGSLAAVALLWALSIVPELLSGWTPADLGARMSPARPDIEYGRELAGLLIVSTYCVSVCLVQRRRLKLRT
jgi:hypothetical protein